MSLKNTICVASFPVALDSSLSTSTEKQAKAADLLSPVFVRIEPEQENAMKQSQVAVPVVPNSLYNGAGQSSTQSSDPEDSDYSDDDDGDSEDHSSQADIIDDISASKTKQKRPFWTKYRGMMLAVCSSIIFTVTALLIKKLDTYDPFNSALYRFQGALIPAIPLFIQKRFFSKKGAKVVERVWPLTQPSKLKMFGLVLLRSFLTCNALILNFFSLKYLSMGDALTIASASPIFVAILARLILGEKCGYSSIIASVVSLLGVGAIMKPPIFTNSGSYDQNVLVGSGLAFGCTILTALSFITLRHIRKVHYSVTTFLYGAWGTVENVMILLIVPGLAIQFPSSRWEEWMLILGLAGLTLLGQLSIILAMKSEQAGPVALVRTLDTLFAFLLDIIVLRKIPDFWSILGASMIVLAVAFVGLRKWVRSLPKDHSVRRKLFFISM